MLVCDWSSESYAQMSGEMVQRLSSLVRDRDLEVESLNQRIKSLLEVLQNEKDGRNIEDLEKRYGRYRTEVRIY